MKKVMLCDEYCYYISDEDYEVLKRVSPGFARMTKDADGESPTHFVCELCGQIAPLKIRELHSCQQ